MTVRNAGGSVTSAAATLMVNPAVPVITGQPVSQMVTTGSRVSFQVSATGDGLSYQWSRNGSPIAGAASDMYTIAAAQTSDAGSYTVTVCNAAGSVTSAAVTLTVNPALPAAPVITSQPTSQTVTAGSHASFQVSATGDGLSYQWNRDGSPITGATSAAYTIAAAQASDAGSYTVTVCNAAGSVTSAAATLIVTPAKPVGDAASFEAIQSKPVGGTLRATSSDGASLRYQIATKPTHGSAVVQADGSFTYQPDWAFTGTDTFAFEAVNGTVASDPVTVTITVHPAVPDPDNAPQNEIDAIPGAGSSTALIGPNDIASVSAEDNVGVKTGDAEIVIPSLYLYPSLPSAGSHVSFSEAPGSAADLAGAVELLPRSGSILGGYEFHLVREDGSPVALNGKVRVTIRLSDSQIAAIQGAYSADVYYYNPQDNTLSQMNATFDPKDKTATFYTSHFSTYVIGVVPHSAGTPTDTAAGPAGSAAAGSTPAVNPKTGDGSSPFPLLSLLAAACVAIVAARRKIKR